MNYCNCYVDISLLLSQLARIYGSHYGSHLWLLKPGQLRSPTWRCSAPRERPSRHHPPSPHRSPGYVCTICRNSENMRNIFVNKTYTRCDETVNFFDSILHEIKVSLESITSRIKAVEDCMVIHKDSIKELENNTKIFTSFLSNLP